MSKKLKRCPFCGRIDSLEVVKCGVVHYQYFVSCAMYKHGCGASSYYAETEREAIKAWNRRCE